MKSSLLVIVLFNILCSICYRSVNCLLCNMTGSKITCQNVTIGDGPLDNITVIITPLDVVEVNIINSSLPSIANWTFSKFKYLRTLNVRNSRLTGISEGAFSSLDNLQNLYLSDNLLDNIDSNIINETKNLLSRLDLSCNRIKTLENFNASNFPRLKLMNVSNNELEFLPEDLLQKLARNEEFYLIVDNNPWNCSNVNWGKSFDAGGGLWRDIFCNQSYNKNRRKNTREDEVPFTETSMSKENNSEILDGDNYCIYSCSYTSRCFSYCTLWFVGGIWIGVILGNVCKIRKLMCKPDPVARTQQEQHTQCEPESVELKHLERKH
ncbi:unnamed protein product [Phyllotreta striolata]|uniref:Uncharacterized protein n=1 Tax=Phyllotreta striolata TaxID=444603 RepID=A0A9N9XHS9_PHYSR|nr:unnamed protein product [Phyllotreta striolata]